MWRLAIFSTRTNENHIRSPLGGGVYDFKLRKTLSQQCLRLRQVTQGRLQNLFRDRSFRILHFICKGSVAQRRPPESFPCPVHVSARAGINHRQQSNRQRLSRGKHLRCMADLLSVCAIQTTKNSHRCLLRQTRLQAQPDCDRPCEQHQRSNHDAHFEIVQPGNVHVPLPQDQQPENRSQGPDRRKVRAEIATEHGGRDKAISYCRSRVLNAA